MRRKDDRLSFLLEFEHNLVDDLGIDGVKTR